MWNMCGIGGLLLEVVCPMRIWQLGSFSLIQHVNFVWFDGGRWVMGM